MKQYLNFTRTSVNYSVKHSLDLIFKKVETVFFSFLCVIFLIISKVNSDFSKDVSFQFVSVSIPIVKFAAFPFNVVINIFTDFHDLVEAKRENEALKIDLAKLQALEIKSINVYQENRELRKILNFVTSKSSHFKVAKIIGRSHQLFNQQLFIDAGLDRGIKEGSIVTGDRGVIGRISEVDKTKSRLILLNDAISRIPVITSKARARGILAGNGSGAMELLYLPKNHSIAVGDWIFTSGDGDTLPPGLLVGVVTKADKDHVMAVMAEDVSYSDVVTIVSY